LNVGVGVGLYVGGGAVGVGLSVLIATLLNITTSNSTISNFFMKKPPPFSRIWIISQICLANMPTLPLFATAFRARLCVAT